MPWEQQETAGRGATAEHPQIQLSTFRFSSVLESTSDFPVGIGWPLTGGHCPVNEP